MGFSGHFLQAGSVLGAVHCHVHCQSPHCPLKARGQAGGPRGLWHRAHVPPRGTESRMEASPSSVRVRVRDLHRLTRFTHLTRVSSCSFFRFGGLPLLFPVFPGTLETFFCPSVSLRNSIKKKKSWCCSVKSCSFVHVGQIRSWVTVTCVAAKSWVILTHRTSASKCRMWYIPNIFLCLYLESAQFIDLDFLKLILLLF